ncbi:MAG: hypothetical protein AMXMBFR7_41880 [Planctomycetota bacterium]
MDFEEIDPLQAHKLLNQGGYVYLDVRTVEEFAQGHPAGARNVPVMERDPGTGQMTPNPEFVRVVEAHFSKQTALLVGCRSGGRSAAACQFLAQAGYTQLWNVNGGFHGRSLPPGITFIKGWAACELPVENDLSDEKSYAALRAKAGL